jgi:hypothetical protein
MSDERNDAGQFTPSTENTSGEDHANLKAGYVPYKEAPEPEVVESVYAAQDIADSMADIRDQSGPESAIVTYSPMDEAP